MTDTPRISVVVPTYNRLDTLRHVIPSLLAQDLRRGEYEVVVADSNSADGTAEYLARVSRDNPLVRHLPGRAPSAGGIAVGPDGSERRRTIGHPGFASLESRGFPADDADRAEI